MAVKGIIGIDIGSEYLHVSGLDNDGNLVYSPNSRMHFGRPEEAMSGLLRKMVSDGVDEKDYRFSFTGSGGHIFASSLDVPFFHDTVTIPTGARFLNSKTKYILHIGSRDPYFFEIGGLGHVGKLLTVVYDNGTGTKCGGGSGTLISKTVRRYLEKQIPPGLDSQERMQAMYELAQQTAFKFKKQLNIGGRCGVVIQSDMVHQQNEGESVPNILNGMFRRIAENYVTDVIRTRQLEQGQTMATGGVFGNPLILKYLEESTGLTIVRDPNYQKVGAIGAALKAGEINSPAGLKKTRLTIAADAERSKIRFAQPLSEGLDKINFFEESEKYEKHGDLKIYPENLNDKTEVVMGVDGGSTTTKIVIARRDLETIAESIKLTNGRPLETIQEMFREVQQTIGQRIEIQGVCYTGSSGGFYHQLFTNPGEPQTDTRKDEITCHALGVSQFNPNVDTIFELGGQDAKFTRFNPDGTVKSSKMNLSCMAGTGQTMENMMKMVGLDYQTFEQAALASKRTPIVDDTCGIFTEAGISRLISLGFPKEEIAAAISFGFIGGYANKFVGNEPVGKVISAQGGPFNNKANLASLAIHSGKTINAFPHRQLFGAYGAAIAANQHLEKLENGEL